MINTKDQSALMLDRMATMAVTKFAASLVLPPLVMRWKDGKEGKNPGKYLVPKIGRLQANNFEENGKVIPQTGTAENEEVETRTFESTFQMSAQALASDIGDREVQYLDSAIDAVKRKVESFMLESIAQDTAISAQKKVGTLGQALTRQEILEAKKIFDDEEVGDIRHLILSTQSELDLRLDADYKTLGIYSKPEDVISGIMPGIDGFQLRTSPRIFSPDEDEAINLAFVPKAISTVFPSWTPAKTSAIEIKVAEQDGIRLGLAMETIPGTLGAVSITAFCCFGAKAVDQDGVVLLQGR